jgi:spore germination cell wall hydrolase CwlJ-like protein
MTIPYDDTDLDVMSRTLLGEARGESEEGRLAVAWVIRNRASLAGFAGPLLGKPGAIAHVCRAPLQFSCWNADDPNCRVIEAATEDELADLFDLATDVLTDIVPDLTKGATNYYAPYIPAPYWAKEMTFVGKFGSQLFFR